MTGLAFPKPEKGGRRREKDRVKRQEGKVVQDVRPKVAARDGYCRLATGNPNGWFGRTFGCCQGASEWAHFDEHKRTRTVGQPPEERHTTAGSLMLCTRHHQDYDQARLYIDALSPRECDGLLEYSTPDGWLYQEPSRRALSFDRSLL